MSRQREGLSSSFSNRSQTGRNLFSMFNLLHLRHALADGAVEVGAPCIALITNATDNSPVLAVIPLIKPKLLHQCHCLRVVVEGVRYAVAQSTNIVSFWIKPPVIPAVQAPQFSLESFINITRRLYVGRQNHPDCTKMPPAHRLRAELGNFKVIQHRYLLLPRLLEYLPLSKLASSTVPDTCNGVK